MRSFTFFVFVLLFISSSYASKRMSNIVGGSTASSGQIPFIVSLDICGSSCGGFLITPTHVGTAAHCFDANTTASCITAQAGTIDISSPANGQVRNASAFNINANYDNATLDYDAAIITLSSPFTIDNVNTRLATLASNSSQIPANGSSTYVAGWGDTATGGPSSSFLLYVDLPYINLAECNTTYNTLKSGVEICAGGVVGKDSCQGDSGGPLFTTSNINDTIDAVIIGIVSFGGNSCAANQPGVYSDVVGFANAYFQSVIATSISASGVAPTSVVASSVAASSVAASSVAASSVAAAASSSIAAAASSSIAAAASSSGAGQSVAASSVAAAASSSIAAAASSVAAAASSSGAGQSAAASSVAGQSAAASSVAGQSAAASSVAAAASSVVSASQTSSKSQSNTPSGTSDVIALSSGASAAASSGAVAASSAGSAAAASSKVPANKTKTGLAAINCRTACNRAFRTCKKTTRRIRTCKRDKKTCVSGCGVVNPNRR